MITQISVWGTDNEELELAHYVIEMFVMPFFKSEDFKHLQQSMTEQEKVWTSKSEKSKKTSKKMPVKKKKSSPSSKKPTKKETSSSKKVKPNPKKVVNKN